MSKPASKKTMMQMLLPALSRPGTYVIVGGAILALDYSTGPVLAFPILFVIPVTLAAWFYNRRWAYGMAILLPAGSLGISTWVDQPGPEAFLTINALVRVAVLSFLAYLTARTSRQTKELEREVKLLEGILPICMYCKRIRDDQQNWQQIESYITLHSEADFSHSMCPACAQKHHGDTFNQNRTT